MGLIAISGQPGCRTEQAARIAAQKLNFELISERRTAALMAGELEVSGQIPDKSYGDALAFVLAGLAARHHLVVCNCGAETLGRRFPGMLRVGIAGSLAARAGNLMLDHRIERSRALELLARLESEAKKARKRRFGRARAPVDTFDLVLSADTLDPEGIGGLIEQAANALRLKEGGFLPEAAQAQLEFQIRLRLAKHGILPRGRAAIQGKPFGHPSEEIFAHLLNFYRIAWEHEPRSFPIEWDAGGRVLKSVTPDFFLPEFNLYVELTTMKQSLVTKKNHKLRRLRELYPDVNLQVFYHRDFENLIFKYGLNQPA
ncbi:MAG: cytidylate kinase-like family protein [Acidobacteria bacterium]|nr:cytidylate kinase-like family protein [Acidobacteriota bacterium]